MVLLYKNIKNIKNEYQNDDISTIEESLEVPGVSKYTDNLPKRYFDDLDMCWHKIQIGLISKNHKKAKIFDVFSKIFQFWLNIIFKNVILAPPLGAR